MDYAGCQIVATCQEQDFKQLFPGLQVCEREYLNIVYEKQEKSKHG